MKKLSLSMLSCVFAFGLLFAPMASAIDNDYDQGGGEGGSKPTPTPPPYCHPLDNCLWP